MRTTKRAQAVILNKKNEVLLIQKLDKHARKKMWRLPKGGANSNESLDQALRREVREETGIHLRGKSKKIHYYEVTRVMPQQVTTFLIKTRQQPLLPASASEEGIVRAEWFSFENALKKLFFDEEKQAVKKALEAMK